MSDRNKAVVRRLVEEVYNRGDVRLLSELVAAGHVGHEAIGDHYGPEGVQVVVLELRAAFPDLRVTLEDLVAEGDRVVRRFTLRGAHAGPFQGIPPSGQRVAVGGIGIDRLADGKLAESWVSLDALALLRQVEAGSAIRVPNGRPLTGDGDARPALGVPTTEPAPRPVRRRDGRRQERRLADGLCLERVRPGSARARAAD
jgi:steroid delta-isomerase-like uncharacterized protein